MDTRTQTQGRRHRSRMALARSDLRRQQPFAPFAPRHHRPTELFTISTEVRTSFSLMMLLCA